MDIFTTLVLKMLPLYGIMAAGYALGRKFPETVAPTSTVQIYLIAPIVLATVIGAMDFTAAYLLLPVIFYVLCCGVGLLTYRVAGGNDGTRNLLAFACGSSNNGYFGLPVALILFPPELVAVFLLAGLGFIFYENTLGYYLIARGRFTTREALMRLSRLPTLYGALLGIVISALAISLPDMLQATATNFRGAYVVLGALIIGLGLSRAKGFEMDRRFLAIPLIMKFVLWPALTFGVAWLDAHVFHVFDEQIRGVILLLGLMPLPANAVAFALQLNVHPEKAALVVFINTVVALFYIPAMLMLVGML
jgi:predicted permease